MAANKRSARDRVIAAHHEAGHAVIADRLGCYVKRVSIDNVGGGLTEIRWRQGELRIERQILTILAGPYAQRRFAPRSRWRSRSHTRFNTGADFDVVTTLIHDLHGKGDVAEKYWAYVEARAKAPVEQHWPYIESVADALLKHGCVADDIRKAFPPLRWQS